MWTSYRLISVILYFDNYEKHKHPDDDSIPRIHK